eukprot:15435243-Alexandrium_andersonii.AAC.1
MGYSTQHHRRRGLALRRSGVYWSSASRASGRASGPPFRSATCSSAYAFLQSFDCAAGSAYH